MAHLTKLLKHSEKKLEKLRHIEDATVKQRDAIDNHNFDVLNSLAEEKQKAINYIDWCDKSFQEELKTLKDRFGVESLEEIEGASIHGERKALREIIGLIIETIERTRVLEKANHRELLVSMDDIRAKLKKVKEGQKSIALYDNEAGMASGSFIDKKE